MRNIVYLLIVFYCLTTAVATIGREKITQHALYDSSHNVIITPAMRDSLCRAIAKNEYYRPVILVKSKESMKRQLVKLVRLAKKKHVPFDLSFDEVVLELDRLPDQKQIEIIALAAVGSVTQKVLQRARKELAKHKLSQIAPSLQGAKVNVDLPLVPARILLHIDLNRNATLRSALWRGKLSATLRQTQHYWQQRLDLRLFKGFYLMGMRTFYPRVEYRAAGLSYRRNGLRFYYLFQKNMIYPNRDRMYLQCSIALNKSEWR